MANRDDRLKRVFAKAAEIDKRRMEQIANQKKIINRLMEINQAYEETLENIASDQPRNRGIAHDLARDALDKAVEINKKHREQEGEQDG